MKIALIGYGKMGHAIERHAIGRGHTIVCRIDADNIADIDGPDFASADVAIEFTRPEAGFDNCLRAINRGVPVVSGTTGWSQRLPELKTLCDSGRGTLLWSSNFSIGVNLFMALNRYLTRLMAPFPQYRPAMNEVHHIHKLDHPSGTALTLAGDIIAADPALTGWTEDADRAAAEPDTLLITHERRGEVPGIHTIAWESPVDTITITHDAKSRDGFALGAVMAAEWLAGKTGYHTIDQFIQELIAQ
ncbi:MAG: 4-hydroxy-tetrahydrodipicolinate reductase [Muribaculaceae bacterium]|nr:4-hydroxy-tetrahydrodipicolinate reductase [Muribaculaceae bacterium]